CALPMCVVLKPCVVVLLCEYPVAIPDCGFEKFLFVEFPSCKREPPCGPRVITLHAARGEHRKVSAPGSVFLLDRDEPLAGTPHRCRVILPAGFLIRRHPAEQDLPRVEYR